MRTRASNWIRGVRLIGCAQNKQNKQRQPGHNDDDVHTKILISFFLQYLPLQDQLVASLKKYQMD